MNVRNLIDKLETASQGGEILSSCSQSGRPKQRESISYIDNKNLPSSPAAWRRSSQIAVSGYPSADRVAKTNQIKCFVTTQEDRNENPPLPARPAVKKMSGAKPKPPVPSKSDALRAKVKTLSVIGSPQSLVSSRTTTPETGSHDEPLISLLDNDVDSATDPSIHKDTFCEREACSSSPSQNPQASPAQSEDEHDPFSKILSITRNPQSILPSNLPGVTEVGSTITQTMNPLLEGTRKGFEIGFGKIATTARPVVNQSGEVVKTALAKTGVSNAFNKTHDDFSDASARMMGKPGLCSKCKTLPVDVFLPTKLLDVLGPELQWATPLSRVIYHSKWCRVCRLILDTLCEPRNDPLKHEAVAQHIQPELKGLTMREWTDRGWDFTDYHWPFGHGEERHEGASYVLGPGLQEIGIITERLLRLAGNYGMAVSLSRTRDRRTQFRKTSQRFNERERLRLAKNPKQYPLSCVIMITAQTHHPDSQHPGLLDVSLLGYGRKLGADVQILSSFRMLAAITGVSDPLPTNVPSPLPVPSDDSSRRVLDRQWINPSTGYHWLMECETEHGTECSAHGWEIAMKKPTFLRVIDVEDFSVKEIGNPGTCRFIALSYVWGGQNTVKLNKSTKDRLMKKDGLLRFIPSLPQTLIDAIEVVKSMNERYLWVDVLCIMQDDQEESAQQISSMDRVYGSALATLVAAQGASADAGLCGIRQSHIPPVGQRPGTPRDVRQLAAKVKENIYLTAPLGTTDHNVDDSVWNSRAWTFQERLLSRRLIIFADGEMIWHCRKMVCREDMSVEESGIPYMPLKWLTLKPRQLGIDVRQTWVDGSIERTRYGGTQLVRSATFAEYAKAIQEYTRRETSYESDVLAAFAGLSQIFSQCFRSEMTFGLPNNLFDVGLLWRPAQILKRRQGFPSWSWAGWVGQVAYEPTFRVTRDDYGKFIRFELTKCGEEGIRPLIQWHVRKHGTRLIHPINDTGRGFPLDENSPLPAEWENGPYSIDQYGNGGPAPSPVVPATALSDIPQISADYLVFWASCTAAFSPGDLIVQASDRKFVPQNSPHRYSLFDADHDFVGSILLDGDDDDWMWRSRYEFVQIAEANYFGHDDEEKDIEDCPLYLVMLIEWDVQRKTATRLGMGRVRKTAWMLAKPQLKLVRLG